MARITVPEHETFLEVFLSMKTSIESAPVKLLNQREAAEILGLSTAWMERSRWDGSGPRFVKFHRAVRYKLSDLLAYVDERGRTSTSEVGGK